MGCTESVPVHRTVPRSLPTYVPSAPPSYVTESPVYKSAIVSYKPPAYSSVVPAYTPSTPPPFEEHKIASNNSKLQLANLLQGYEVFFCADSSGSMSTILSRTNPAITRWQMLQEAATAISAAADVIDANGSTLIFFDSTVQVHENQPLNEIEKLLASKQPNGVTNLHEALKQTFNIIKRNVAANRKFRALVVIVTDGVPSLGDTPNLEGERVAEYIVEFTRYMASQDLGDEQVGITFFQIGEDRSATEYLRHLDDNLITKGALYDIVDTVNFAKVQEYGGIMGAFLKAFND